MKSIKFLGLSVGGLFGLLLLGLLVFRIGWVDFIDNYELGFVFHTDTGKIEVINRTGYVIYAPFFNKVHTIDLRPYQVSITPGGGGSQSSGSGSGGTGGSSIGSRVLNAKLVQFNTNGLGVFLATHGRDAADSTDNMLTILKAYAFDQDDGRDCPFLTISKELSPHVSNTIAR